jgi:hypothetical protein
MKNDIEYPYLAEYYRLTNLLDPTTGRLNKIPSEKIGSDASNANHILTNIEWRSGVYSYFNNRVQEAVGVSMLNVLLESRQAVLSQIVNDLLYGVDVVMNVWWLWCAVDLTSNPWVILDKLQKAQEDGKKGLIWPDERHLRLPFIVLYTAHVFHHSVARILEWYAKEHELTRWSEDELATLAMKESLNIPEIVGFWTDAIIYPYMKRPFWGISDSLKERFSKRFKEISDSDE